MKTKKIFVFLLAAIMVLQIVPVSFANAYDEGKIEVSAAISGMDLSANETVTRAQFARILALSMTGEVYTEGSKYFEDVSYGDYAYGSISYLASMGIIAGDGVNFHPDKIISKNEALKMVVTALGYRHPAEEKGGYFSGYLAMATKLKLLDDCSNSATLTGKDAMMIMYNTMHADMLEVTSITQEGYVSEISDVDFLEYYRGIFKYTGIVNATAYAGIGGYSKTERNAIVVGNITLENTLPIHNTYIGRKVDAYYKDSGNYEAVYIKSNEQSYEIYTAEEISDNPLDHSLTNLKLNENGANVKISQYADFILNGRLHASVRGEDLAFNDGYVELIDNGGESGADVVIINSIEYARVSATDDISSIIYGGPGQKYELSEAEFFTLTDENGKDIGIEELASDDILEVMESSDARDKILQIKRVRKSFSGKITSLGETKTGIKLIGVGDTEYKTTRAFTQTTEYTEAALGKYAIFYLNANDEIACVKYTDESDMLYGYLLEAENGSGISSEAKVKVYTQENKCEVFDLTDKVSVNYSSTKQKEEDVVTCLMEAGKAKQQMIKFSLNKNREINKIFVADELSEFDGSSEFYRSAQTTYKYSNSSKMLYVYAEKTTAFYVGDVVAYFNVLRYPIGQLSSSGRLSEDDLYVSYAPHMVESGDCNAIIYDYGYTKNARCLIVEPQSRTVVYDTNLVLVNDVKHTIDENGEDSIKIYGWKKSQKAIYEPSEYMKTSLPAMISTIKSGDIMIATFDRLEFGQLETVKKVFSKDDEWEVGHTHYSNTPTSLAYGKQTVIRGTVFDRDEAVIVVDLGDGKQTITTNYLTNYYFYDKEAEEYVPTAGSEIRTARDSGQGSRVVVYSRYGVAYDLIILD